MLARCRKRLAEIGTDGDDQRIIPDAAIAEEPRDVIDNAFLEERPLTIRGDGGCPGMFDPQTDAGQPARIFPRKTGPDNVVQPDQSDAAVRTQIDRCVEGGEITGESANIITPRKLPSSASTRRVTLIVIWCDTRPVTGLPMKMP